MSLKGKFSVKITLPSHELIPMGNYSKLINRNTNITYELTSYSNYRHLDKFNDALLAFMDIFKELNDFLMTNSSFKKYIEGEKKLESYKVNKDNINNYSIKFDKEHPDHWTKCMKDLLTILQQYILLIVKMDKDYYQEILDRSLIINSSNS